MATVKRRADRGNRWEVRYRDPGGLQRARLFGRKVDAERFLTSVEHSKLTGGYVDPSAGKITFRAFAGEWRGCRSIVRGRHSRSSSSSAGTSIR